MEKSDVGDMRKEYGIFQLDIKSVENNPVHQFEKWFKESYKKEGEESNTMTLSTIGFDGCPEGRIILLKFYSEEGFTFYSNHTSAKGKQLEANSQASLTLYWKTMERQVRIKGNVEKVDESISDKYFESRPRESKISAWASPQSEVIKDRTFLDKKTKKIHEKFKDEMYIPRPSFWGGYLLKPYSIEFWQGRPGRLHDRIVYDFIDGKWNLKRIAP